ncbi:MULTISPECIES: MATE family efflux transporter [unclassified Sporosarcina]|uniref:MATE family efflux transporter n=1 Tax=unclassified Sporosarcina TaxID=2647733 RepID=UPI00203A974A|nr:MULTISPECIES: MATE family efflux transporter [unclassified Sporosarcina]GKV67185.1 putative multidrug resistance protein YpnP [Sporosarcina sp. NCCP-2331]GLB57549.1 putative multidrug resistance protein YpnP [Sporosarcina sp. NCCP-2378]
MQKQHDFTQGNLWKQLIVFSGPIMLTNLLQTSYQFADSLWVGNLLGASALGSVAVSSTIIFTVLSFVIGLNNSALTILSQQKGRGDEQGMKRYLNAYVVILTIMSFVLGTIGYLSAEHLLRILGTPESMMAAANSYLQINFIGMLFLFGYNFISTVLRSLGDSKTPLRFVMIAVALNIVLDPLFIAGFGFGIEGAAYATILAQGSAFVYGLLHVLYRKLAPFSIPAWPAKKEIGLILNIGIPSGLQMAVISAGAAAIMSVVTVFGEDVVGGYGAAQRLDSLVLLPAQALGTAISSMAGQNIGVKNWSRVKQLAKYGVLYSFAVTFLIGIIVVVFAQYGVRLFIREEASVAFGTRYLQIVALCYPFLGINFVLNGIVRASGAMYQVLALNIISFWVLRYPLAALFSRVFGDMGIGIGVGISFLVSSFIAFLYFRFGKWREKELFV